MKAKFSKHAIERLRLRFAGHIPQVIEVAERGIFKGEAVPAFAGRWQVLGTIAGRQMKVVFAWNSVDECTIITALWKSRSTHNANLFGNKPVELLRSKSRQ